MLSLSGLKRLQLYRRREKMFSILVVDVTVRWKLLSGRGNGLALRIDWLESGCAVRELGFEALFTE